MRALGSVAVFSFAALATGCLTDRATGYDRPARLEIGVNSRHFGQAPAAPGGAVARSTTPTPPPTETAPQGAISGAAQFTMIGPSHTYWGGEVEAGKLDQSGSNLAGLYGVFGLRSMSHLGSLSAELVGGWRSERYFLGDDDHNHAILEPRLRAQLWIADQVALGAAAGVTLGEAEAWMAGIYLGIHSHAFGSGR